MKSFPRTPLLACAIGMLVTPSLAQVRGKTLQIEAGYGSLKGKVIYGASHALLIGVNEYPNLPKSKWLDYALNDVKELKEVLEDLYGFPKENITVLTNAQATKDKIMNALTDFADRKRVKPHDRILVYFSGHGQTVKIASGEMGFILPYDAKVDLNDFENAAPFLKSCIKMETIWDTLESTPAKHALLLADACYSGLAVKGRSTAVKIPESVLLALTAHRALQVITAGRKGEVSVEMARYGHGAFTYKLLEHLKAQATTAGLAFTATDLAGYLQTAVGTVTDGKQNPQFGAHKTDGEWVFITTGASAVAAAPTPVKVPQIPPKALVESVNTSARIKVESTPPGAKIYLDGEIVKDKVTPATIEVDLGLAKKKDVEVGVSLDGHKPAVKKASVARGDEAQVAVTLAPTGSATVKTPPTSTTTPAAAAPGIGSGKLVAVIPVVNSSKEKVAAEREKQAVAGTEELTKQFAIRGYKTADSAAVMKAIADEKLDFTNRDLHNKPALFRVGKALGADYVAFAVINDVGQKSNFTVFASQREGRAQLSVWLVDVKVERAIVDGVSHEGKSARGGLIIGSAGVAGSPRIIAAVGNAIKAALLAPLGPMPTDK